MKPRYRIIKRGDNFYTQYKVRSIFGGAWRRIGRHIDGKFGLYEDFAYPMHSQVEAVNLMLDFKLWQSNIGKGVIIAEYE